MSARSRQSFLGVGSAERLAALRVGIIGLGGGGSHIAQQLAHVGIGTFILSDHDRIDETNLNRLVGGTLADVKRQEWKTVIAARQIRRINPTAKTIQVRDRWQAKAELLRNCDIIVGCVDSFSERAQLEEAARRYLTPYLDIGMDVFEDAEEFSIVGQVALSMPDRPCLRCMGIIRDELLREEAARYGAAGGRPQVIWPNGILASLAVGVLIQLMTPWHADRRETLLLEYDGNSQTVNESPVVPVLGEDCRHFGSLNSIGDPWYSTKLPAYPSAR